MYFCFIYIYLLTGYLTKRLIAPIIYRRVIKWLVNNELEIMSRDMDLDVRRYWGEPRITSLRITDIQAEIWLRDLVNTTQKWYPRVRDFGHVVSRG
jgi:hypothetical protein